MVTAAAAWLLRRRTAAVVHRIWTLGFAASLLIPVVSLVMPTWTVPLLPQSREIAVVAEVETPKIERTSETTKVSNDPIRPSESAAARSSDNTPLGAERRFSQGGESQRLFDERRVPTNRPRQAVAPTTMNSAAALPPPEIDRAVTAPPAVEFTFPWVAALLAVWIAGVVCCLLRMAGQQLALTRVLLRSAPILGKQWTKVVSDLSHSLELRRSVQLVHGESIESPLSAGIFRPLIALPEDAEQWRPAKRQLVLLHELAHISRRDVLTQTMAGLACAWQWFNPLCWLGLSQMRKLRELACDDLVVSLGEQPADYADVLLTVARSYRHRRFATAVGMAHGANVEKRILAILDKARSRVALTRKAARVLLVATFALVALIGSMQLRSQSVVSAAAATEENPAASESTPKKDAKESGTDNKGGAKPAPAGAAAAPAADDGLRTMQVFIRDENGRPLEGARLHVGVWYTKDYQGARVPKDHQTNADGLVSLRIPRRLFILRMWASKSSHVPEFVNFAQGTHDEGIRIPDQFEFKLARGTELSGKIVDESGQPIAGAKVQVMVEVREPMWTVNPKPMISTWLTDEDFDQGPRVTDEQGIWKTGNAPAAIDGKDFDLRLMVTHPNYAGDTKWGELQSQQKVTTAMLRDGSAKIILKRGAPLVGKVVDPAGNPIKKGIVVWHDSPYHGPGNHEVEIEATGRFETDPLAPGEHPITIVAPGFCPQRQTVLVNQTTGEKRFELQPGNRLVLKIVNPQGDPIPKAYVSILKWRGAESLYNWRHPNVLNSRIPNRSSADGNYVWDWAPEDTVTYQVSAAGVSSKTVTLLAREEPHVIQLDQQLVAAGKVTDAATGKPVKRFRVIPVTVFRPMFLSASFRDEVPGVDGSYQVELSDNGERDDRYQVRIEADGYRSAISEKSYGLEDGRVALDFTLEPAAPRQGRVVDAEGKPIPAAEIVEASPTLLPVTENGKLDWGARVIESASDGRFELAATFEPVRIRITHAAGFAEVQRQPNEAIGTIHLEPWAKLSGQLLQDGRPVPNHRIRFAPVLQGQLGEPRFQDAYHTNSNAEGRFEFNQLPPIAGKVHAYLGPWEDSPLTSSQAVPLDLKPGESKTITLGGDGVTVSGRIFAVGRGNAALNKNWSLNYLIRRDGGIALPDEFPKLSFDPADPLQAAWFLDPNADSWRSTRDHYFVKLAPDGQLRISGVPPGVYDLVLQLYEQPTGCLVETIGEKVIPVEIGAAEATVGSKDLGAIEVSCRVGPRIGENMQAYEFLGTDDRQRSIREMKGGYVLLHVWASWCAPCLESMPDIQATTQRLADRPITFVAFNIDKQRSAAEAIVKRNGWNWSQNYLGDDSDIARQLAISSVPTYYLIDRDGLLAASATSWSEMKGKLSEVFNE